MRIKSDRVVITDYLRNYINLRISTAVLSVMKTGRNMMKLCGRHIGVKSVLGRGGGGQRVKWDISKCGKSITPFAVQCRYSTTFL
jgi:hypothetical protein